MPSPTDYEQRRGRVDGISPSYAALARLDVNLVGAGAMKGMTPLSSFL